MQAVILVGGEGTRLRPLTSTVPKPVVPLVDRPFIVYMLEWLHGHGVTDAILSCGFLATSVRNVLGDGSQLGLRLRFVEEPEPRGTAGALKYAEEFLAERFLMLNGDTLTDIDLSAQLRQHEETGATGTLALVPVDDPSSYGLVRLPDDRSVNGSPQATVDGRVVPPAVVERGAHVAAGAHVGSLVVLADGVQVGEGTSIERSVVLQGAQIGARCKLVNCIVAAGARVGDDTEISGQ